MGSSLVSLCSWLWAGPWFLHDGCVTSGSSAGCLPGRARVLPAGWPSLGCRLGTTGVGGELPQPGLCVPGSDTGQGRWCSQEAPKRLSHPVWCNLSKGHGPRCPSWLGIVLLLSELSWLPGTRPCPIPHSGVCCSPAASPSLGCGVSSFSFCTCRWRLQGL